MLQIINQPIVRPIRFSTPKGKVVLSHPTIQIIPAIVRLLQDEGLDLRRLAGTASQSFTSIGEKRVDEEWNNAVEAFRKKFSGEKTVLEQIIIQSLGVRAYNKIPIAGTVIRDPFNMVFVEGSTSLEKLVQQQLENMIIVKADKAVVALGRVLEVEANVELVSLWTHKEWRRNGLATKIIHELLRRIAIRPIFSFQQLSLVPFYLRKYGTIDTASVCTSEVLPLALQRDLFFMNIFWGPYVIIKIG